MGLNIARSTSRDRSRQLSWGWEVMGEGLLKSSEKGSDAAPGAKSLSKKDQRALRNCG